MLAALLAFHVASATAPAAPKRITGKLSKPGYTVIALDQTGEAETATAAPKFKLRPPAKRVSLHLQAEDGTYAGPVVVGVESKRKGKGKRKRLDLRKKKANKRVIVGVKAGAKLGKVKVSKRKGYAKLKRKLRKKSIDRKNEARAKKGVPIGAGKFGLVLSKVKSHPPPGDLDADGVSDPLDIDDNGNLVLDRYESPAQARASGAHGAEPVATAADVITVHAVVLAVNPDGSVLTQGCGGSITGQEVTTTWPPGSPTPEVGKLYEAQVDTGGGSITVLSVTGPIGDGCPASEFVPTVAPGLALTLEDTVNANAAALSVSDIDETLARRGFLYPQGGPGVPEVTVELDCGGAPDPANPGGWSGGLSYCTRGGTGLVNTNYFSHTPPRSWPLAFPGCCDPDGDGFGALFSGFLSHGATTDQIGTGDVLNWRVTKGGVESQFPTTLPDVFATVPALVSYRDGAGNSRTLSYPVPPPYVGSPPDFFGESQGPYEGFPVAPCPPGAPPPCVAGDIVVTFEFWRPQREAIPGVEQGQWTDIGGLVYSALAHADPARNGGYPAGNGCKQSQLSTTDPSLTPEPGGGLFGGGGFRDSGADRPADPANTLSFSVNLTKCFEGGAPDISVGLGAGLGNPPNTAPTAVTPSASQGLYFTPG